MPISSCPSQKSQRSLSLSTPTRIVPLYQVAFAPAILQRAMESIVQGIPKVVVYLNDILVAGDLEEAHLRLLGEVLDLLKRARL